MNTILRTLLYEWKDRKLPAIIPRDTRVDVSPSKTTNMATVVTGFRRVGKTYMLYEAISQLLESHSREEVVYINFEDERILAPTISLLTDLIPETQALYGQKPKYLFLDELQLIPNWSKWVRRMLDSESIQIFITGSSSKMSSAELPTELRGRAWEIRAYPLSFGEFLRFKNVVIDFEKIAAAQQEESARFRFLFDEYLTFGALPAVVLTPAEKKAELLQSYFQTVVQRDIAERHKIDNDLALRTLLKLLLNSPYITISKLHNSLKSLGIAVGKSTIDSYLAYIKTSYFMNELHFYSPKMVNQLLYPRKVYFVDTGFMTALSTHFSKNTGRLFENVIYHKLAQSHPAIYYYKDSKGNEVDFAILEDGKTAALYQVCVDLKEEQTREREVKSLMKAGKELQCQDLNLVTLEKADPHLLPQEIHCISASELQ